MSLRRYAPRSMAAFTVLAVAAIWLFWTPKAGSQPSPAQERDQPKSKSPKLASTCPAHSYQVSWPEKNPVWTLCWNQPMDTTQEVDGSGLRLGHVHYKGKKVLEKAGMPCLNVRYQPPTACDSKAVCCGTTLANHVHTFTYRDWLTQYAPFKANNILVMPQVEAKDADHVRTQIPGYAEPTEPPTTLCDAHPNTGKDVGEFYGVAIEKRADQLIMTTHLESGWYRYTMKWIFFPDGTIQPRFAFTAVDNACTSRAHHHNAYWRFDFDIGDPENDVVEEVTDGPNGSAPVVERFTTERNSLSDPDHNRRWRIIDKSTGLGYEIIPGTEDGVADDWGAADLWALRYKENKEHDDGGFRSGRVDGARAHLNEFLDDESIDGQDVVTWYHAGHLHLGGLKAHCDPMMMGPTLKPVGAW
jgi:copper amine oxidase-like protein